MAAPTSRSRRWAIVGLCIALLHLGWLGAIGLFDGGRLADEWQGTLAALGVIAFPAVVAWLGLRWPGLLLAAGLISLPLAFVSLAGATLPLIVPAICYLVAYGLPPRPDGQRTP